MEKAGFPSLLCRVLPLLCWAVCPWLELGGISEASLHLSPQQDAVKLAQGETEARKAVIHGWSKGVWISSRGHQGPLLSCFHSSLRKLFLKHPEVCGLGRGHRGGKTSCRPVCALHKRIVLAPTLYQVSMLRLETSLAECTDEGTEAVKGREQGSLISSLSHTASNPRQTPASPSFP